MKIRGADLLNPFNEKMDIDWELQRYWDHGIDWEKRTGPAAADIGFRPEASAMPFAGTVVDPENSPPNLPSQTLPKRGAPILTRH